LTELYKGTRKKLFCAFIDFEKAFDSVWRVGLWNKLLESNINGKCLKIILNMYNGIKAKLTSGYSVSDIFPCEIGVRQGENLSPFLFSVFLNDLESFLLSKGAVGLSSISQKYPGEITVYVNLFVLLYADDTILLAETAADLQQQLNSFSEYCCKWRLKVNASKTKILIFGKSRQNLHRFTYNNVELERVDNYKYLGIHFTRTGNFSYTIKQQYEKAIKAMYSVLSKCKRHNLSIECQLKMFDTIIQPILLYGCEVWGFSSSPIKIVEKLHLKFLKYILHVKNSTPNFMVYGELGRFPLLINIKVCMITFWAKLVNPESTNISCILYNLVKNSHLPWLSCIRSILNECGLTYIWDNQNFYNIKWLRNKVIRVLQDQYIQKWQNEIHNSSKGINYRCFKDVLEFENYFNLLPDSLFINLCKFRTSNINIPIETGRWNNTPRSERKCTLCINDDLGDEFHYLFTCSDSIIKNARTKFIPAQYYTRPNVHKYNKLFSSKKSGILSKLCKFISIIKERVCPPR
jgi:hypothetical protein